MPVGNDVVDLGHPQCQPDAIHPRFDSRAFSAAEIAQLQASTQVHRTRWSMWAAKESAFKAARKLDPQVRFLPRNFSVRLSGERAEVTHRLGCFDIWLDRTDEWLHAVASLGGRKPGFRVDAIPSAGAEGDLALEDEDSSRCVRRLAQATLGDHLNLAPSEVQIVTVDRIPEAQWPSAHRQGAPQRGQPLPVDLSLSHDGRFVACAWEKTGTVPDATDLPGSGGQASAVGLDPSGRAASR